MAHHLPGADKPAHGAPHRHDRHRIHGTCRRSGTRRIRHSGYLLHGTIHAGIRLQRGCRNPYGPPQRRGTIPLDRQYLLSGKRNTDDDSRRRHPPLLHRIARAAAEHPLFAGHLRGHHGLYQPAHLGALLLAHRLHVPCLLHGHHTHLHPHAERYRNGTQQRGAQLHIRLRETRPARHGDCRSSHRLDCRGVYLRRLLRTLYPPADGLQTLRHVPFHAPLAADTATDIPCFGLDDRPYSISSHRLRGSSSSLPSSTSANGRSPYRTSYGTYRHSSTCSYRLSLRPERPSSAI